MGRLREAGRIRSLRTSPRSIPPRSSCSISPEDKSCGARSKPRTPDGTRSTRRRPKRLEPPAVTRAARSLHLAEGNYMPIPPSGPPSIILLATAFLTARRTRRRRTAFFTRTRRTALRTPRRTRRFVRRTPRATLRTALRRRRTPLRTALRTRLLATPTFLRARRAPLRTALLALLFALLRAIPTPPCGASPRWACDRVGARLEDYCADTRKCASA
jgi:hypothetical protein